MIAVRGTQVGIHTDAPVRTAKARHARSSGIILKADPHCGGSRSHDRGKSPLPLRMASWTSRGHCAERHIHDDARPFAARAPLRSLIHQGPGHQQSDCGTLSLVSRANPAQRMLPRCLPCSAQWSSSCIVLQHFRGCSTSMPLAATAQGLACAFGMRRRTVERVR